MKLVFCCFLFLTALNADTFSFSFDGQPNISNVFGTVSGTVDLPFVVNGSGSGASNSVTFSSLPAFGAFTPSDAATWVIQQDNFFTVQNDVVTSVEFFATSGTSNAADLFCVNSTASDLPLGGGMHCPPQFVELSGSGSV
jgi:hypothetical protein